MPISILIEASGAADAAVVCTDCFSGELRIVLADYPPVGSGSAQSGTVQENGAALARPCPSAGVSSSASEEYEGGRAFRRERKRNKQSQHHYSGGRTVADISLYMATY